MGFSKEKFQTVFHRIILTAGVAALFFAIGMFAYLGSFSRYLADDYCEAERVNSASSPIAAVVERYSIGAWRAANRYSNITFVGFSEMIGANSMPVTVAGMALLWVAGLCWSVYEARKFFAVNWPVAMDIFLGTLLGFFSFQQAPNLFQTIYWRSSMMTHFAPLVFLSFLIAFALNRARKQSLSLLVNLFILFAAFVIAGFSEPPTATMVTALSLLLGAAWFWDASPARKNHLTVLAWMLAGFLIGLITLILSPAIEQVSQERTLSVTGILFNSFYYAYLFSADTIKTLPLPNAIALFLPLLLLWLHGQADPFNLKDGHKRAVGIAMLVLPLLAWLLIAAGFSPSVYGQGFPVERMRFLARTLIIAVFMTEGMLLGVRISPLQFKPNPAFGQSVVLVAFAIVAVAYPLRSALNLYKANVPEYSQRAAKWDLRNAYILRHAAQGEKDLVVPGFSGVYQIKELDSNSQHWVNVCAAWYYDVNSIRSVTVPDEELMDYLNE